MVIRGMVYYCYTNISSLADILLNVDAIDICWACGAHDIMNSSFVFICSFWDHANHPEDSIHLPFRKLT